MEIVKTEVRLPSIGHYQDNRLAFILDNVLTEKECLNLIKMTEDHGYEDVKEVWRRDDVRSVPSPSKEFSRTLDVRKSQRCIIDRGDMAGLIWNRIKEYIPETWNNKGVVGLNERLRFLKYSSGQYFKSHKDGSYKRPDGSEQSFITIQLYLNEGMEGGNTTFISRSGDHNNVGVVPKIGRVLVFQQDILHEGSLLVKGIKYTMRTDVMYTTRSVTTKKQDVVAAPVTPSPVPNIIPGLNFPTSSSSKKKKKKKSGNQSQITSNGVSDLATQMSSTSITEKPNGGQQPEATDSIKRLRNLKKKLRDIEALEAKLKSGAIDKPEPEQLTKVAKKPDVMKEIVALEKQSHSNS